MFAILWNWLNKFTGMNEMMEYLAVLTRFVQYSEECSFVWMVTLRPPAEFESATFIPSFSRMLKEILPFNVAPGTSTAVTLSSPAAPELSPPAAGASSTSRTLGRLVLRDSVLSFLSREVILTGVGEEENL